MADLFEFFAGDFRHVGKHVIFVHGLGGDARRTWQASDKFHEFWPLWLQAELPDVAVWSVGYHAGWTEWWGAQAMHLTDRADNVFARLMAEPKLRSGDIIFVAYSHGGLVVKQLIRSADRLASRTPAASDFLSRIRRVVFLATPHQGADLATLLQLFRIVFNPSAATRGMVRNDPSLRELYRWFRSYRRDHEIETLELTETKISFRMFLVVKPDSADGGLLADPIPVDADHFSITKPRDVHSEVYIYVRDFIAQPITTHHERERVAEAINQHSNRITELTAATEALPNLIAARIAEYRSWPSSPARGSTALVDAEVEKRLTTLLKSRFFRFDRAKLHEFVDSLRGGELANASSLVKSDALAWCARICVRAETEYASNLLDEASNLRTSELTQIAAAMLVGQRGDRPEALSMLYAIASPRSWSASFNIVSLSS